MIIKLPKNVNFVIDKEFESLIPPLTEEEFGQLRENILEAGMCHDPLIVWLRPGTRGDYLIVDGHNRWRIIQEFIDTDRPIAFEYKAESFSSREEAKAWMIRNQLGRRNLPSYERARLALQLKPILAEEAKRRQAEYHGNQYGGLPQKSAEVQKDGKAARSSQGEVREQLAKAAGVSHDTIAKVEKIEARAAPELKAQLRRGELSINKAYSSLIEEGKKDRGTSDQVAQIPGKTVLPYKTFLVEVPNDLALLFTEVSSLCGDTVSDAFLRYLMQSLHSDIAYLANGTFRPIREVGKERYVELAKECERLTGFDVVGRVEASETMDESTAAYINRRSLKKILPQYTESILKKYDK